MHPSPVPARRSRSRPPAPRSRRYGAADTGHGAGSGSTRFFAARGITAPPRGRPTTSTPRAPRPGSRGASRGRRAGKPSEHQFRTVRSVTRSRAATSRVVKSSGGGGVGGRRFWSVSCTKSSQGETSMANWGNGGKGIRSSGIRRRRSLGRSIRHTRFGRPCLQLRFSSRLFHNGFRTAPARPPKLVPGSRFATNVARERPLAAYGLAFLWRPGLETIGLARQPPPSEPIAGRAARRFGRRLSRRTRLR
jgi:hypothetical protein